MNTMPLGAIGHKFTGKERDTETGLDYFGARYYGSNMGRWMSPDWSAGPSPVPYANLSDPQSLNLYAYLRNNPMGTFDPDGHTAECAVSDGTSCAEQAQADDINPVLDPDEQENKPTPQKDNAEEPAKAPPSANESKETTNPLKVVESVGGLPPQANPALQAAKQATRGVPKPSAPPELTPKPSKPPSYPEDFQSKTTRLLKEAMEVIADAAAGLAGGGTTVSVPSICFTCSVQQQMQDPCGSRPECHQVQ